MNAKDLEIISVELVSYRHEGMNFDAKVMTDEFETLNFFKSMANPDRYIDAINGLVFDIKNISCEIVVDNRGKIS